MRRDRVEMLLQYALSRAAQEDFGSRELGPIHLVKLLYLADLEYAKEHSGQSFTETPWRFYHFGPWDEGAFLCIEPAMEQLGANARHVVSVRYESETTFWSLNPMDPETAAIYEESDQQLPLPTTRAIARAIHAFGTNTSALLDFVYKTAPMTKAAPREVLNLGFAITPPSEIPIGPRSLPPPSQLSRRQQRDREEAKRVLLEKLRRTPASGARPGCVIPPPAPRDEVYFMGLRWMDALAGDPLQPFENGVMEFDEAVWKSDIRTPSDLS